MIDIIKLIKHIMKKRKTPALKTAEEMSEHYKELFETSVSELKFANMCVAHLANVLEEIKTIDDKLCGLIAENGLNRHEIDKIIHAKEVFNKEL